MHQSLTPLHTTDNYAAGFEDPGDCLRTVDDIKDALIKCGVDKPKGLKGDLIEQLLAIQPNAQVYDELKADYTLLHHGKEFVSGDLEQPCRRTFLLIPHPAQNIPNMCP